MTKSHSTTVRVNLFWVHLKDFDTWNSLSSESFVQFDDIHIINCLAGTFQSLWYSIDRSKTHHCCITT